MTPWPPRRASLWLSWLVGLAMVATVIIVVTRASEARALYRLALDARPWWLLAAFGLQVVTYPVQGEIWRVVTRAGGVPLGAWTTSWLSLGKLFIDQALPSAGISGNVLMVRGLEQRGTPRPVAMAALIVDTASCYATSVFGLGLALLITFAHHQANALVLLASVPFAVVGVALTIAVLGLVGGPGRALADRLGRHPALRAALDGLRRADPHLARRPRLLLAASGYQLAIIALDVATIWALVASLGARAAPAGVFVSFMISTTFRVVGLVPGGLGTFEAVSVLTLKTIGVSLPVALAATLLFRGLSFWLPMVPGMWLARQAARTD